MLVEELFVKGDGLHIRIKEHDRCQRTPLPCFQHRILCLIPPPWKRANLGLARHPSFGKNSPMTKNRPITLARRLTRDCLGTRFLFRIKAVYRLRHLMEPTALTLNITGNSRPRRPVILPLWRRGNVTSVTHVRKVLPPNNGGMNLRRSVLLLILSSLWIS